MSAFLKKNWKWIAGGAGLLIIIIIAFLAFRVVSFIGDTTGAGRTSDFVTPTPDIQATSTAQARAAELFGTATPGIVGTITSQAATPTVNFNTSDVVQKIKNGEPITFMVAGYGGAGHEGAYLTDSILVLRYDPKTKTVQEFNIPRDLYLNVPYGGKNNGKWAKVNTILTTMMTWNQADMNKLDPKYRWTDDKKKFDSGINLIADSIEQVLGLRIDYWATLSFDGFRRFIDAMGGVEIDVERYFIDKKYPKNDDDTIDASYITIEYQAGKQVMNGEQAIRYARSRYSETPLEGGDFARSKRQMRLITAVKEQVFKKNLVLNALSYMDALQGNLRFSLSWGELTALANYFNSPEGKTLANDIKFSNEVLNDDYLTDSTINGDYILMPIKGQGKYADIQNWVQSVISNAGIRRESARVQVLNANGTPGIAAKFTDFLLANGFRTSQEQDGGSIEQSQVIDYTQGASPNTIARLKSYLPNLNVIQKTPDQKPSGTPAEANIQIYLGKDFKGSVSSGSGSSTPGTKATTGAIDSNTNG